jgi:hypothetical protein
MPVCILPKIGPLKVLRLRTPTPETERMFEASFNATLDRYRILLHQVGAVTGPGVFVPSGLRESSPTARPGMPLNRYKPENIVLVAASPERIAIDWGLSDFSRPRCSPNSTSQVVI